LAISRQNGVITSFVNAQDNNEFNIISFGAKGDNKRDNKI